MHRLDHNKNLCAYNDLLFGYLRSCRKHEGSPPSDYSMVKYKMSLSLLICADLKNRDGKLMEGSQRKSGLCHNFLWHIISGVTITATKSKEREVEWDEPLM